MKSILKLFGALSPVHIFLVTLLSRKKKVGVDQFGNVYYSATPRKEYARERRWVIYKGEVEPTAVPPEWHGWLHFQTDAFPDMTDVNYRKKWQKPHQRNMTGTSGAYRPPGHVLSGGERDKATGDYEAWTP